MPLTIRPTGLKGPDRDETRTFQLVSRRLHAQPTPLFYFQPIARIRRQPLLGDCVGEAPAGGIHALTGFDPSARDLWREAQRRETGTFDPNGGAMLEYCVEGIIQRGLRAYQADEEFDTSAELEAWTEGHSAHDLRQLNAEHWRIVPGDLESLYTALVRNMVVFDGGGVTEKFMKRVSEQASIPADLDELGGNDNGHAQRIVGYWRDANFNGTRPGTLLLYQGSWDTDFAGCFVPTFDADGNADAWLWEEGCFWALARTFGGRWDCHCISVKV